MRLPLSPTSQNTLTKNECGEVFFWIVSNLVFSNTLVPLRSFPDITLLNNLGCNITILCSFTPFKQACSVTNRYYKSIREKRGGTLYKTSVLSAVFSLWSNHLYRILRLFRHFFSWCPFRLFSFRVIKPSPPCIFFKNNNYVPASAENTKHASFKS